MRKAIESQLATALDASLVRELLDAHEEARRNFYLGGLRLSEVEGGRFCEAAFRILEQITTGKWTPLGKQLNTEKLIDRLRTLDGSKFVDSVRLHIPRALRLVYDIRNKRDAAHLADGIDPSLQDATLVISTISWVLAEFVRMYHGVSPDEAHRIVDDIVARTVPIIQDFDGALKILNTALGASEYCLVLLYHRGNDGASFAELDSWVRPNMRTNLRRTLRRLDEERAFIHLDGRRYRITRAGGRDVELRRLFEC
jgi:hypothetical protein